MPTKRHEPGDNFCWENSDVLSALIRRLPKAQAKILGLTCWDKDNPLREVLHVDDQGKTCVIALESWQPALGDPPSGLDLRIRELAEQASASTGLQGEILWDKKKSDGTTKKQLDVSRLAIL